ncbi:MAG: fructosamine kinase family protein [Aphanocapsa sp. GSE-SYN-MK-11-07L]|jgi:fructosamine-3-kinase|nr:fructosamine kinase family protein [Aphanocapsa sp. GSE-SYN-MK-11-07L]
MHQKSSSAIAKQVSQFTGTDFLVQDCRSVGGGSINQAYILLGDRLSYFVKFNQPARLSMFEAEALALRQIAQTATIRVPQPICLGITDQHSYLVLEHLNLVGSGDWQSMGRHLAALHQKANADLFGWQQDNTIGSTPQSNPWSASWPEFFTQQRLGYQLKLAQRRGGSFSKSSALLECVAQQLQHQPTPALVHGDLWSGNAAFTAVGQPVIFDPAAYYGDREVDLAMTELFGGFPASFYQGYQQVLPISADYQQRKVIYNLYHILNHFNLFGGGYASQAHRMIEQILRA